MSKLIFETLAGSRLYGVETSTSDYDYKGVFLESLDELLLKSRNVVSSKSDREESEHFCLNYYMTLLGQGQVIPVDMLFAPEKFWRVSSPEWEQIRENKSEFISAHILPFIGYAKAQALKYGSKGTRLGTIDKAIKLVEAKTPFAELINQLKSCEGITLWDETRGSIVHHIDICGKSFGETTNYNLWLGPLKALRASYGGRALLAVSGIDLKAQYHTVRICSEALELLLTGNLTFPRPEADTLIKIRLGQFDSSELETLIDSLFVKVKNTEKKTKLKSEPNKELMHKLVTDLQASYLKETI